ncbi:Uma2 family endonuclease [Cyanobacteria bacterium FACHB-DQ100]|nr:Uma2 family endonuclease [Cyanobacteria bacterium FACHB-DQ100]
MPYVLIAFGRPKGRRGAYRQWEEEDIPVQVVFDILSPSNTGEEMSSKFEFYQTYGVEEYYLYNPYRNDLTGWIRRGSALSEIQQINGWISPRLGIRFELTFQDFVIYRPDGDRFLSPVELKRLADQERQRVEQERQRADRLAEYLRSMRIDPDQIPD